MLSHGMLASNPGDSNPQSIFVTRRGREAVEQGIETMRSVNRLQDNLHPLIEAKARRQFLIGEYENAIFVSMKAVEIRVRQLAGFRDEVFGTDFMTKAFNKSGGSLTDPAAPSADYRTFGELVTRFRATVTSVPTLGLSRMLTVP
nr:TIGR02391 family protein [Streptomyces sp. SID3212]